MKKILSFTLAVILATVVPAFATVEEDVATLMADVNTPGSVLNSIQTNAVDATYSGTTTLGDAIGANASAISTINSSAAMTSGIDSTKVGQIATNATNIGNLQTTVGNSTTGLVKDVSDLQTAVAGKQATLTEAQLNAANSGITAAGVTQITTNQTNIATLNADASTAGSVLNSIQTNAVDATYSGTTTLGDAIGANASAISTINSSAAMTSGIDSTKVGQIATNATNIGNLQTTVGNSTTGLVKDVSDLQTAVAGKQATLTEAQLNAANSGITSGKVSTYDGYATTKQDALNSDQLAAVNSGITSGKVSTYDGYATTKQDTLNSDQLAAVNSGIDSTKVAQIETNKNNIATNTTNIGTNTTAIALLNNADDTVVGSVKNSVKTLAAAANYDNTTSQLTATTLQGAIDENAGHIATNTTNIGTNTTAIALLNNADDTVVGSVKNSVKTLAASANYSGAVTGATTLAGAIDVNAGNISANTASIGDKAYANTNYVESGSSLTAAVGVLDGQAKINADGIANNSTHIGNLSFTGNASGAADLTVAVNKTNTALGDVSTLSSAKGTAVKVTTNVTDAVKAIDSDFHRAADGRLHIGANSFIFDDTNGNFSYENGSGVEQSINFTKTPTVNGTPLATSQELNHLQDESRTGIASVAALTALQPLGIESGRLQFALGSGFYQGESAVAAGANYYVTDNLVFNAGAAMDTSLDNHVIKAGLSVGFLKPKKARTINANNVVINAAKHTTVKSSKDAVYVTPEQYKALVNRIEALEKELAKRK